MTPHGPTVTRRRAVDIEHYRTLLQNEERRLLGIIKRKKENVRSIGGDSVPDAGERKRLGFGNCCGGRHERKGPS